jgi:hypothetical protein
MCSVFGDAVSASYVPFQSDHKVMAHSGRSNAQAHNRGMDRYRINSENLKQAKKC